MVARTIHASPYCFLISATYVLFSLHVGMGLVNFLPLGSGFGFFDFVRVGSRVFWFFLGLTNFGFGSTSGQRFFKKSCIFQLNTRFNTLKISGYIARVKKKLTRVKKKVLRVGSGPPKNCSGRVGLAKTASGRVKSWVGFWPDPSLI